MADLHCDTWGTTSFIVFESERGREWFKANVAIWSAAGEALGPKGARVHRNEAERILLRAEEAGLEVSRGVEASPDASRDVCSHCERRNTSRVSPTRWECFDCGHVSTEVATGVASASESEPDACDRCQSRNIARLDDAQWECHDCGEILMGAWALNASHAGFTGSKGAGS